MPHAIALGGVALHSGATTSVVLAPWRGPLVLEQGGVQIGLSALRLERADRGVQVTDGEGRLRVDLVEHLLAAVEGLGVRRGLRLVVFGSEVPLLDGGARRLVEAVASLRLVQERPRLRVARRAVFDQGDAHYELAPADGVHLEVHVQFAHELIAVQHAAWSGDAADFASRIAPARTFGFLREAGALRATGRARGANRSAVIVLGPGGSTLTYPPPAPDECVRHKLLDLIGDLALHGGVPIGSFLAFRPGHAATHAVVARALAEGVLQRGQG